MTKHARMWLIGICLTSVLSVSLLAAQTPPDMPPPPSDPPPAAAPGDPTQKLVDDKPATELPPPPSLPPDGPPPLPKAATPPPPLDDAPGAPPSFPPASPRPGTRTLPSIPGQNPSPPSDSPRPDKPEKAPAIITVTVPANAVIWIGDQRMTQTGPTRSFQSPPLERGKAYAYLLRVSWPTGSGQKDYMAEHEVTVRAGQMSRVDFTPLAGGPTVLPTGSRTEMPVQPRPARPRFFNRVPDGSAYR
jgi:uncharacterized protein (TIGR03000 family)